MRQSFQYSGSPSTREWKLRLGNRWATLSWLYAHLCLICLAGFVYIVLEFNVVVHFLFFSTVALLSLLHIRYWRLPSLGSYFVFIYLLLFLLYPLWEVIFNFELPTASIRSRYGWLTTTSISSFILGYHFIAGGSILKKARPTLFAGQVEVFSDRAPVFAVFSGVGAIILIANAGGAEELLQGTRVARKLTATTVQLIPHYMIMVGSIGAVLAPAYLKARKLRGVILLSSLFGAAFISFLANRSRTVVIMYMVAALYGYLILQARQVPWTISLSRVRRLSIAALGIAGILLLAMYLRFSRGAMELHAVMLPSVDMVAAAGKTVRSGELGMAPVVYDVLRLVPEQRSYLYGQSYYRLLFTPIPRSLWPSKPINTERLVGSWIAPDTGVQSLPPGVQGDAYINFGLAAPILLVIMGCVLAFCERRSSTETLVLWYGVAPAGVFHLVRGGFTNPIILLIVLWIGCRLVVGKEWRLAGKSRSINPF